MVEPIANTASGSRSVAASSQCRAHSARPYSPADPGVRTSRTKRFILVRAASPRTTCALSSYGEAAANSILPCAKVPPRGFRSQRQDARVYRNGDQPEGFDGPGSTQATGARLAVRGQA